MEPETKRDILIAREAWRLGADFGAVHGSMCYKEGKWLKECDIHFEPQRLYPMPKITRPRIRKDSLGHVWRVLNGELQVRWNNRDAFAATLAPTVNEERAGIWNDLYENPTETVEDSE